MRAGHLRDTAYQVRDLEVALAHCRNRECVVQAGGGAGVWPAYLARNFMQVITFEPNAETLKALRANVAEWKHVHVLGGGLSDRHGMARLVAPSDDNAGADYIDHIGPKDERQLVAVTTLDRMLLPAIDLLVLDIEGAEFDALVGARETILRHRPVVMLESKILPQQQAPENAIEYLRIAGYRVADRVHNDVVMVPK